jgi:hypothetical protein
MREREGEFKIKLKKKKRARNNKREEEFFFKKKLERGKTVREREKKSGRKGEFLKEKMVEGEEE